MTDPWHYPRPADAQRIVDTLRVGLVSALAIIEPRRRGKTTFLLDDLQPVARASGFVPIYLNLAATSGELEPFMATSIESAVQAEQGVVGRLKRVADMRVRKVSGRAGPTGVELSGELDTGPDASRGQLGSAFARVAALGKPVLFLLDEVHRLAAESESAVAWSLRSLLDGQRQTIKVVATSSSAASYEILISGEKKAFNRWFTRAALKPLGDDFVAHLAAVTRRHFPRHQVRREDVAEAFDELGQSPKFLRDYLNTRILHPHIGHAEALAVASREAAKDSGFEDAFQRLVPLQKTVLVALACGQRELFSDEALVAFGSVTTGERIAKTVMQRAVRTLADKGWIVRHGHGQYALADLLFAQWLEAQMKAGLLPGP